MELINQFKAYLGSQANPASKATIKNYVADVRQFLGWLSSEFSSITPSQTTPQMLTQYFAIHAQKATLSARSCVRHKASLRKFFQFLESTNMIVKTPFETIPNKPVQQDNWQIKQFKDYLYISKLSHHTIINYIADLLQFCTWIEAVSGIKDAWDVREKNIFTKISAPLLVEYKERLLYEARLSPASVNRKLSSLRTYLQWLHKEGILGFEKQMDVANIKIITPPTLPLVSTDIALTTAPYSRIPPLRVFQKIKNGLNKPVDEFIINPLAKILDEFTYRLWQASGKQLKQTTFTKEKPLQAPYTEFRVTNVQKALYAPAAISIKDAPFHKKLSFHIRHTRPKWYKSYHSYSIVHYFHFAILIVCMTIMGVSFYQVFAEEPRLQSANAAPSAPPRFLSFQGRLTDPSDNPIAGTKSIRFALYNSQTASGSAFLWEEKQDIATDKNGIFSVQLGTKSTIPQTLFADNANVYLGVTVGNDEELKPRQQLAAVGFATNAELLQGLSPITQTGAGTKNVVLALDSTGDLAIGGSANPTFRATGGRFTLSGQTLFLTSNAGSAGDVVIAPDGVGKIDFQKPIHNSTNSATLAGAQGAVQIDDLLAIFASGSAQSALLVEQTGAGPLISASKSGTAKFTVGNDGSGYFAGNLGIGVSSPVTKLNISGATVGKALMILNETGNQNVIVASASGSTKFVLDRDGNIKTTQGIRWQPLSDSSSAINIANSSGTSFVTFDSSNTRVGIGTSNPGFKLEVTDSQAATVSAMLINSSIDADADVLALKVGITTNPSATNRFLTFLNGSGVMAGKVQGNGTGGVTYDTGGGDFAEYFQKEDIHEVFLPGDVVCLGPYGRVTHCKEKKQQILGVISNQAGFVGNSKFEYNQDYVLVGLLGQLPVRVHATSGVINGSDPITILQSNTVTTARNPGFILGRALESYNPSTQPEKSTLLISLSPTWYDPDIYLTHTGDLNIVQASPTNQRKNSVFNVENALGKIIERIGVFSEVVVANITAGAIEVKDIAADTLSVNSEIISPIASIDRVHTNVISPLSEKLVLQLASTSGTLEIQNAQGAAVATIDQSGNASFSGTLASKELQTSEASVSGVLRAGKIVADSIEGVFLSEASPSSDFSLIVDAATEATSAAIVANTGTFQQGLLAFGPTTLSTTAITGQLSIGSPTGGLILAENAINVLGANIELQPLKQGGVSFIGGLIEIDVDGNLRVDGKATFGSDVEAKGSLFANLIAPIPNQDLVIQLEDTSRLVVQNASESAVLTVDAGGNLTASGSATARTLVAHGFGIIRSAQADTSLTETVATSSAGTATILPGEKERTIYTPFVKKDSLIYVTATSDTQDTTPYVARQTSEDKAVGILGSFTIEVQKRVSKGITLNWWIVN